MPLSNVTPIRKHDLLSAADMAFIREHGVAHPVPEELTRLVEHPVPGHRVVVLTEKGLQYFDYAAEYYQLPSQPAPEMGHKEFHDMVFQLVTAASAQVDAELWKRYVAKQIAPEDLATVEAYLFGNVEDLAETVRQANVIQSAPATGNVRQLFFKEKGRH